MQAEPPAEPEPVITNTAINTPIVPYDTLPPPPLPIGSPEKAPPKNIIPTPLKIGFIGLGIMGQGMCMNLIKSGHEVTVWNRTAAKVGTTFFTHTFTPRARDDLITCCLKNQ